MDFCQILGPKQKALSINVDNKIYGTIAEIGAGQEVSRYFFQAGGAAGTIAKTMSAYDMTISDTIYGKEESGRYVCEDRLVKMLTREYELLIDRLSPERGSETKFFVFSDTVAAKSYSGRGECHGWLGIRFQHEPCAKESELILHVRMLDQENIQQQEAVGLLGVNMLYSCFNHTDDHKKFVSTLMDNLSTRRIEIDMIKVRGEAFAGIDSRILSLELVKRKYTQAIMFDESGEVLQARDNLYKRNLVVSRGSFRPPTHVNMDMLKCGKEMLEADLSDDEKSRVSVISEISMSKLIERGEVDNKDFLARVELLSNLDQKVLITNFDSYFELNRFLVPICKKDIAFVSGVYNLEEILDITKYENNPSGILGGLGDLFSHSSRVFVYPALDDDDDTKLKKMANVPYDESIKHLVQHLIANKYIQDVVGFNKSYSKIWSRTVLKMIQDGEEGWEEMVPAKVAKTLKEKSFFKK